MALADITRQSVLDAVAEYDSIGRDAFLAKYGFRQARSYMLEVDERRYDSKAIAGAAHRYATGRALRAHDFSGGAATVQPTLEALGFRVIVEASPPGGRDGRDRRPGVTRGLSKEHIAAALHEWNRLGREAFMARFGGQPAERYVVVTSADEVDALALVLAARALAGLDTSGPWRGDRINVAEPLAALGFRIDTIDRPKPPEVQEAEEGVESAAGRAARQGSGQGFGVDPLTKLAIEDYAMASARRHYELLGEVVDTAARKSWDYEVDIGGVAWHIEVKGTTGHPVDVILTPNEVAHAQAFEHVALYVVGNIDIEVGEGELRIPSGGNVTIYHPWTIDTDDLRPLGYKYRLPPPSSGTTEPR